MTIDKRALWKRIQLPVCIMSAFIVMAAWVAVGRLLFGVFGWIAFVTLFLFAPIIIIYGVVLTIIVAVRQRNYRYQKRGPFMISLLTLLALLFCVGFFMPDFGDTSESASSALSVLLLDRANESYIGISGFLAGWAVFFTVIASIVTFILAFVERPKKTPQQKA